MEVRKKRLGLFALLALAGLFAGCTSPATGDGGAEVQLAGVLASDLTLAGRTLELAGAQRTKNGEPAEVRLRPGMVVEVEGTEYGTRVRARRVDVRVELKGPLAEVRPEEGKLFLLGTEVRVDALTRFEEEGGGTFALADLKAGDYLEVSGVRSPEGYVLATYVERKAQGGEEVELYGFACGLTEGQFDLWASPDCADPGLATGLVVSFAPEAVKGTPREGARVEVEGRLLGERILAYEVEFKGEHAGRRQAKVELYGPISKLDEAEKTFVLAGYRVDYGTARVKGRLAEGAFVEVEGRLTPEGVLAYEVEVKYGHREHRGYPVREVKGVIEALDPEAGTFEVGGIGFFVDEATLIKEEDPDRPLTLAELRVGDYVEVKYDPARRNEAGAYYAVKVERERREHREGYREKAEVEGRVEQVDPERRELWVGGVRVVADDRTRYEHLSPEAFWERVAVGDFVEAEGRWQEDGSLLAYELELKGWDD